MTTTEPCRLSRSAAGLHFAGTNLSYRITGLTAYNLDRLRVTLKANPADTPNIFHIDTVDLYNSRGREFFAEACAKYLKAQQSAVMAAGEGECRTGHADDRGGSERSPGNA
jgi:hypothetical protein